MSILDLQKKFLPLIEIPSVRVLKKPTSNTFVVRSSYSIMLSLSMRSKCFLLNVGKGKSLAIGEWKCQPKLFCPPLTDRFTCACMISNLRSFVQLQTAGKVMHNSHSKVSE